MTASPPSYTGTEIAIVGMAGRFPGAANVEEYWRNLRDGVECLTTFTDDELRAAGVDDATLADASYVKVGAVLGGMEDFDAGFFGFSPRDAAILDPQHRHFLECAWEALEHAGHVPERFSGAIGVFAGSGHNAYMPLNLMPNRQLMAQVGMFLVRHTGNDKDFLTTRLSYLLDLNGPSVNVQTACSTSLVAIHMAVQSLLAGECDMALAGGVTIEMPHRRGYQYHEGEILSPDGHCRPFDAESKGTVFGSGAGVVVLRRLADALADGDVVHAVVRGTAVNNDGSRKVGYLAPSVDGQVDAISEALTVADVDPATVTFIETHGTGTPVGDPIEVAALTQAFRRSTDRVEYCALGSVKSNIGHLDTAAGVAGVIKTVQALAHGQIPPTLHFCAPNPAIEFAGSPFYVNGDLREWVPAPGAPRRAGVSSLGVGGTNAHVVLEEAPAAAPAGPSRAWQLLQLSARSPAAVEQAASRLAAHLAAHPGQALADVAHTLRAGRREFAHRRVVVCRDGGDAIAALSDPRRTLSAAAPEGERSVAFMFAGGGAQYVDMGRELYATEAVYRAAADECLARLRPQLDFDLAALLFPAGSDRADASAALERTSRALPAIFTTAYATAQLWMSWGVHPQAMIGHSLGEYVAACLSGVLTLDEALALVTLRGRLFETLPPGAMLSVPMTEAEVAARLGDTLSISAVNAPALCVVGGPEADIAAFAAQLATEGIEAHRLHIAVAAHSRMLEPIMAEFGAFVRCIPARGPRVPYASNVTGRWITAADLADPTYWVRHLRHTVRFADGLSMLLAEPGRVLLECGPGQTLVTLARQHPRRTDAQVAVPSLRHPREQRSDIAFMLESLGRLWMAGVPVDWSAFAGDEVRRRVPLPSYPFERQRYWIEAQTSSAVAATAPAPTERRADIGQWFAMPVWKQLAPVPTIAPPTGPWLVFVDECGLGQALVDRLQREGADVVSVRAGDAWERRTASAFTVRAGEADDYDALLTALRTDRRAPAAIAHLWALSASEPMPSVLLAYEDIETRCFRSLLLLTQALGRQELPDQLPLMVVTNGMQQVAGEALLAPEKALVLGPTLVAPREIPALRTRSVDVVLPDPGSPQQRAVVDQLIAEATAADDEQVVAYRGHRRFVLRHETTPIAASTGTPARLRHAGVYLVTGGLGGVALAVAEALAVAGDATIVLVARSKLPPRAQWDALLAAGGARSDAVSRIRRVRAIEALGAQVEVVSADVGDLAAMRALLADVRRRHGALHGVLHTAGVLDDGLIMLKTPEAASRVLRPKVRGTLVLDEALRGVPLDFFILFSSISSFSGLPGQVDYAAANAFLDAFAHHRTARDGMPTTAVNWSAWQEIGMAAALVERMRLAAAPAADAPRAAHPMLGDVLRDDATTRDFTAALTVGDTWLLDEHRLRDGSALLPGTGYLELARAAFAERDSGPVELSDVVFLVPFAVADDESRALRVTLQRSGGGWEFTVATNATGQAPVHARGRIGALAAVADVTPPVLDVAALRARCAARVVERRGDEPDAHLRFGPRWHNLRRIGYGDAEALLDLVLPDVHANDLEHYRLHPALLDMATAGAQSLVPGVQADAHLYVPLSYGRLQVHAPLTSALMSHVRLRAAGGETAVYDVTIADASGRVLVEVQEFTMRRVRDTTRMTTREHAPSPGAAVANQVLQLGLQDGIRPHEGVEVMRRLLDGLAVPQLVVSPQPLEALLRALRADGGPGADASGDDVTRHERPAMATPFVAPRTDVERTIAEVWATMLGLTAVGVHDNFFELGGHSLLLTQTVTRVRALLHVDVPLRSLFERPSVAELAQEVENVRSGAAAPAAPALRALSRDAFRTKRSALADTPA